jgi:hypothetical protein
MERDEKGRLQKGHGGLKPKGAISERTEMWNKLGEYVVTQGAERAMQVLGAMEDEEFLKNYMTMLEYFKPKQGRTVHASDTDSPVVIQIHGNI